MLRIEVVLDVGDVKFRVVEKRGEARKLQAGHYIAVLGALIAFVRAGGICSEVCMWRGGMCSEVCMWREVWMWMWDVLRRNLSLGFGCVRGEVVGNYKICMCVRDGNLPSSVNKEGVFWKIETTKVSVRLYTRGVVEFGGVPDSICCV